MTQFVTRITAGPILQLENIHTYYGASHVLQGVSLSVNASECVALLGRNGAGKTTTINSIVGFVPAREGRLVFNGEDVTNKPPHQIVRRGIGLVPQGRRIFPELTVRENVLLGERRSHHRSSGEGTLGAPASASWSFARVLELFPSLKDKTTRRGSQLSGGEQQMVAFARALVANPELLLLDEPSEGLAPLIVREIGRVVAQIKESGYSILLVEQNLGLALTLADRVYVVSKGKVVFEGTPQALRASPELERQYLGV
jgi:branched-chain amino acid transport system ATP-binding protein